MRLNFLSLFLKHREYDMAFCSKCGTALEIDAGFCSSCGAPARSSSSSAPTLSRAQANPERPPTACSWCSKEMTSEALKCPGCGKWRKDISTERVIYYSLLGVSLFFLWIQERSGSSSFFASPWVWLFALTLVPCYYYYARLSKKMKTWWWI